MFNLNLICHVIVLAMLEYKMGFVQIMTML